MYNVKEISPQTWDEFQTSQLFTPDVQSSAYGDFYESTGERAWYFGVFEDDKIVAGSLVVSVTARRGTFIYLPYGPVISEQSSPEQTQEILGALFSVLRKHAKARKAAFIRVSPFWDDTTESRALLASVGAKPAPLHILAETTWLLTLNNATSDSILKAMNKNHRNLIRRCEREGVQVDIHTDAKKLEDFQTLLDTTAKRHNFTRFSRSYIEKEFAAEAKRGNARLILGYLPDGTLDAGAIIYHHGSMSAYRHGASLGQNKKLPASYAVQWAGITDAIKQGSLWYNFWGIAPDDAPKSHPFFGITHYKKGFGGMQKDLVHCHDIPISKKYYLTWIIEHIRKLKRGF